MIVPEEIILDQAQLAVQHKLELLLVNINKYSKIDSFFKKSPPKGLYIYGQVGRGKTMLMDAFYDSVIIQSKTRVHFHQFMQYVHELLKDFGDQQSSVPPIKLVAKKLADQSKLFCFDEFHVTDIADAMILARLFKELFDLRITLVTTSNQPPQNLYKDGLHRERFLPFISLLSEKVEIVELDSQIDYRRQILSSHTRYFIENNGEIQSIFNKLSNYSKPKKSILIVNGHEVQIPCQANGVVWFKFSDVCESHYGPADYIYLAEHYHSFIITEIPQLCEEMHNEAKRFITLIDILYDQGKNLIIHAANKPDELYNKGTNAESFKRTASRLIEMTGGC